MREPGNIADVAQLPIQYMGFIFYPKSSRYVGDSELQAWLSRSGEALGDVARVGVFVNAEFDDILNRVHDYELDYVQLHGTESPEYCAELTNLWSFSSVRRARVIRSFPIDPDFDFAQTAAYEPYADLFLFDTKGAGYGGTGRQFDWSLLQQYHGTKSFLLSGGIQPDSVAALLRVDHPQMIGVDINSGFEEEPARKKVADIDLFIRQFRKS